MLYRKKIIKYYIIDMNLFKLIYQKVNTVNEFSPESTNEEIKRKLTQLKCDFQILITSFKQFSALSFLSIKIIIFISI